MIENIKSTLKNSFIYSLGSISTKLAGLVLIPLYTDYLTVSEYGILALLEISSQLLIAVFSMKINSALFRWYWDEEYKSKQKPIFFTTFIFTIIISLSLSVILSKFAPYFSSLLFNTENYTYLFRLLLISAALQIISQIPLTLMRLQEKSILYSSANIARLIITLIVTIYFITSLGKRVEAVYEAQIIGHVIFFIIIIKYILNNIEIRFQSKTLLAMLAFSFPLIFVEVSSVVFNITSRYCLNFLGTLADVGTFSLGFKIANSIHIFLISSAMLAVFPIVFKKMNDPDNKRFYSKLMTYFSFVVMIFILTASIFSKEIIKILTDNREYWVAHEVIPLICLTIFFGMLKTLSLIGLHITKKTKTIAIITVLMTLLNIGLNLVFVFYWKSIGAAIATLLSQIVFFISIFQSAQKQYYIPFEIIKVVKILLIGFILYLLSFVFNEFSSFWRLTLKSTLILIFPLCLYFFQFFEEIELIRIKEYWKRGKDFKNWKNLFTK